MVEVPRRLPPTPDERLRVIVDRMTRGAVRGGSRWPAPVLPFDRVHATTRSVAGGVSAVSGVNFYKDRYAISTAGAQPKTLTYLPITYSEHVYLNGVEQDEGLDWNRSGRTLNMQTDADLRSGDVLECRYAYLSGLSAGVPTSDATYVGASSGTAGFMPSTLPGGTTSGDLGIGFVMYSGTWSPNNGWADHGSVVVTHAAQSGTYTYRLKVVSKIVTGSTDVPTLPVSAPPYPLLAWVVFRGVGVTDVALNTVADGTSGSTPAVSTASSTARCWATISNVGTIAAPGSGTQRATENNTDVDLLVTTDSALTAVSTTNSVTAGWLLATVGVG